MSTRDVIDTIFHWGVDLLMVRDMKTVLIITDGSEKTSKMANGIVAALKGNKVEVKVACDFKGNDLLPADAFFFGCEKPEPNSFAYLTDLLRHINLAGRPCGVFSPGSEAAARYLGELVCDCEAALKSEPLLSTSADVISKWAQSIVAPNFNTDGEENNGKAIRSGQLHKKDSRFSKKRDTVL
jgi:hypothetical protein